MAPAGYAHTRDHHAIAAVLSTTSMEQHTQHISYSKLL
jgi:hypothetical protein